ncbi:MAG: GGDEF domain-containing protein [Woeseiaceae bacterium]
MPKNLFNAKTLPLFSFAIFALFWLLDSLVHVFIINDSSSLITSLISPSSIELWSRTAIGFIVLLFFAYSKISLSELQEEADELGFLVTTDPITLLFNKRKFYDILEYEIDKSKRYKVGFSIIICQVDDMSKLKNKYNKAILKSFLRTLSLQLISSLRKTDPLSHSDSEGFYVLVPDRTAVETKVIAEKIQFVIENFDFEYIGSVTASFGISQFIEQDNKVSVVNRAKQALEKAQDNGSNSVEIII